MSSSAASRRKHLRKKDAQVSLFPFLAVLICTMGALIVLLVVLVQQAKVQAEQAAENQRQQAAQASHVQEEQRLEQETYDWRLEVLRTQQEEIRRRLADERLKLSHVEDHYRRLRAELQGMLEQAAAMERVIQGGAHDAQAASAELARLHQAIAEARRQVDEARQKLGDKPEVFALIPYHGPQGTRRRPLYIECLRDKVVLQPEGVALTDDDFEGPLGPGNPLDAALRAAREYLARTGGVEVHGEPYPLMVVRSQGPRSYAAARAALESWDDEFGYELIDDDLVLQYPPADPALKKIMETARDEARRRQQILRAAQPNRYRGGEASGFQATPHHGGFRALGDEDRGEGGAGGGRRGEFESVVPGQDGHNGEGEESFGASENNPSSTDRASADGSPANGSSSAAGGVAGGRNALGQTTGDTGAAFAASRGRNWGLKDATQGATPYTRPITVQCFPDRLVLAPERGAGQQPVEIPMQGRTREAVDPFMQALWKRMDGWGLAGNRAYWKPVLKVEVAPGAEGRFLDLQRLMDDSGLVIERKTP